MPYKIHSVQIHVDGGAAVNIADCLSAGITNDPQMEAIITAGDVSPTHVSLIAQRMSASFDTFDLPTAIDKTTLKPLDIVTVTNPGVTLFLQRFLDTGLAAGSTDRSLKISAGAVVPRRISCDHQGNARMSYDVVVTKETGNNAVIISDAATVPTLSTGGSRWTIGATTIGGVVLTDYTGIEIDLGNTVMTRGSQSDIWDAYVEVRQHAPTVTVSGINPKWFTESTGIGIAGLACTHANTVIYLRKRDDDGADFVENGTAEHIKFTCHGVAAMQQIMRGDAHRFTDTSVTITCAVDDSANNPIVVDTASAIT